LSEEEMRAAGETALMLDGGIRISSSKIRGGYTLWQEDLSELLKSYERLSYDVSENLVAQYLHSDEVSRAFAAYWHLYRKYGTDYAVEEILSGFLSDAKEKVSMAQKADFDERFTLVNLLLTSLNNSFVHYVRTDARLERLHGVLQNFKRSLSDVSLSEFIARRRDALKIKEHAQLLTEAESREEESVLSALARYELEARKAHLYDNEEVFACAARCFAEEVALRQKGVEELALRLQRAFTFLEECFGDGQEMVLFLSALSRSEQAMTFISVHGCEKYMAYSEKLLYRQQEDKLRKACRDFLSQTE